MYINIVNFQIAGSAFSEGTIYCGIKIRKGTVEKKREPKIIFIQKIFTWGMLPTMPSSPFGKKTE
jgi:hypothetical protein